MKFEVVMSDFNVQGFQGSNITEIQSDALLLCHA